MLKCQGECSKHDECSGEVHRYIIAGGHWDGLEFDYCEAAHHYDMSNGIMLKRLKRDCERELEKCDE